MDFDDLPDELKQRVADELAAGEKVAWAGRPDPAAFARGTWAVVLFGVPWTAFAVFWTAMAAGFGGNGGGGGGVFAICFPLWGVPFILVGLGMLTSPYWARRTALGTVYVVTDRRAILFERAFRTLTVKSFLPDQLTRVYRVERSDGSGDVVLREDETRDSDGDRVVKKSAFVGIPDVRRVEALIRDLAKPGGDASGERPA